MKAHLKIVDLIAVLAFAAVSSTTFAQAEDHFAKGNEEFAAGRFAEAISQYDALVQSKEWSAALFYNLGNAWFRSGDFGRAVLNYKRALALEPSHPEAKANLRIARDEARALVLAQSRVEIFLRGLDSRHYVILSSIALWVVAFAAVALLFSKRRRLSTALFAISAAVICGLCVAAIYILENGADGRALAIVLGKEIEARVATAESANRVLVLPAGSEIKIESRRGEWIYATLPSNLRGWIPAASAETVRM